MFSFSFTHLLDEREDEAHGPFERLFVDRMLPDRQMRNDILQVVVQRVVLGRQLGEEQLGEVRDSFVGVFETLGHLAQLPFDLDHPVENQMREDHQRVLLDRRVGVGQALVQAVRVLPSAQARPRLSTDIIDERSPRDGDVAQTNHDIAPDNRILAPLQDVEQQRQVFLAKLGRDTHELGHAQHRGLSKLARLLSERVGQYTPDTHLE